MFNMNYVLYELPRKKFIGKFNSIEDIRAFAIEQANKFNSGMHREWVSLEGLRIFDCGPFIYQVEENIDTE